MPRIPKTEGRKERFRTGIWAVAKHILAAVPSEPLNAQSRRRGGKRLRAAIASGARLDAAWKERDGNG